MKNIYDFLQNNILITDGAMGTYYSKIVPKPLSRSELENINNPEIIKQIHREYIDSGAKLIRTNTFAANKEILHCSFEELKEIITKGYEIALSAVGDKEVYIGADIGPIPDSGSDLTPQYLEIANIWLELGADVFVFETFSDTQYLFKIAQYIKSKNPKAFILAQCRLNDSAITESGLPAAKFVELLCENEFIDALGFNCGIGPMHMMNVLKGLNYHSTKPFSALPNAGYPDNINDKIEYVDNPEYFALIASEFVSMGIKIIGGCCGTTPVHIKNLSESKAKISQEKPKKFVAENSAVGSKSKNKFYEKLSKDFVVAVELDPPFKADASKLVEAAKALKKCNVDIITIADSPMGKSRADSIVISSMLKREVDIDVLPHICCRDKNAIALRSGLLGAYIEGIRNVLVVTGDPVPGEYKDSYKSVFNMHSYTLMNLIKQMNEDVFAEEPIHFGGAANFNVKNKDNEYKRLVKKQENGAEFFLTQPIFTDDTVEYIKSIKDKRNCKLLSGIMPLVSYKNAQFINNELPGITIPEKYVSRFKPDMDRNEAEQVGIEIAVDIAQRLYHFVDGFYIVTPFNRYNMIAEILKRLNVR